MMRQHIAGLIGQRRVQGDEVRLGKQLVQRHFLHAHFHGALRRQERVIGGNLHLEAERAAGHDGADIARADETKRLAGQLDAHEAVLFPLAGLRRGVRLRNLARQGKHERDGVFRRRDRVAERRVHHHHALCRGVGDVDIVDADTRTADHLEVGGRVEDLLGHLGRGPDGEAVILADHRFQLVRRLAGNLVHLDAAIPEDLRGLRVHLVGNEYFGHDMSLSVNPVRAELVEAHFSNRPSTCSGRTVMNGIRPQP